MAKYREVVQDDQGNALASPTVTVYDAGTSNLATIYSDEARSSLKANPFTGGSDGEVEFFADPAEYGIKIEKSGFGTLSEDHLSVGSGDLSEGVSGGQTLTGGTAASDALTLETTSDATKGKILFGNSTYDEANNRLGIGTTSPGNPLDVIASSGNMINQFKGTGTNQIVGLRLNNGQGIWDLRVAGGANTIRIADVDAGTFPFRVDGGAVSNTIYIKGSGNVLFGGFSTESVTLIDAGSTGATQQDWIEVTVGGVTGYIRVFATK